MNSPQYLHRLIDICHRCSNKRSFIRPPLAFCLTGRTVPCARHNALIILNLAVFYPYPMSQCTPWRFIKTVSFCLFWPCGGIPFLSIMNPIITLFHICCKFIKPHWQHLCCYKGLHAPCSNPSQG